MKFIKASDMPRVIPRVDSENVGNSGKGHVENFYNVGETFSVTRS